MEEIENTWKRAAVFWWAFSWRSLLYVLPATMILGALAGAIFVAISVPIEPYAIYFNIVGGFVWLAISLWIIKSLLSKSFGGFRVALIKVNREDSLQSQD